MSIWLVFTLILGLGIGIGGFWFFKKLNAEIKRLKSINEELKTAMQPFAGVNIEELRNEKKKLDTILSSSENGILLVDSEGHLQAINPKGRALLDIDETTDSSWKIRPIWSFVQDDRMAVALREAIQLAKPPFSREVNLSQEGIRAFYLLHMPLPPKEHFVEPMNWQMIILRNISAVKELEQLKDDFLQSLTHDLRSPITAIRGYLQILTEEMAGTINDEQRKILFTMQNATFKLLYIVSNLLDTAKMSAGKFKVVLNDCNLRRLVPAAVELFHTEALKKKQTLTVDLPDNLPTIQADGGLIERVFTNFISNAIKFTPDGGFITIKLAELAECIQVQVTDTGVGFPTDFLDKIFKKFEQVPGTRGGTGLGLAICKHIIDCHYGQISVRTKMGQGTTFIFTLPKNLQQNEKGQIFLAQTPPTNSL